MKRGSEIAIALVGGAAVIGLMFWLDSRHKTQSIPGPTPGPTPTPAGSGVVLPPSGLPWLPPSMLSVPPTLEKIRNADVTPFPVDVWSWRGITPPIFLAVASDDPTSFVGYSKASDGTIRSLAMGTGPLTSEIVRQI